MSELDIENRLRQPLLCEDTMQHWDRWRRLIINSMGSLPRDQFEAFLDGVDEDRTEAADLIASLRTAAVEYEAQIKAMDAKIAAARKEAMEEAALYHEDIADQHQASALDGSLDAQSHHANQMIAHVGYAEAIRRLAGEERK